VLALFRAGQLKVKAAAEQLGLARSRFYELYSDYLQACAHHQQSNWTAGLSGGDHAPEWPAEVDTLLHKRLGSKPPASYSFAASEVLRKCHFKVDRAQVRRWAIEHHLAHPKPNHRPPTPVRRWQRSRIASFGNWTPHPIAGFLAAPNPFP
jgi:hypothetical protein